MAVVGLGRIGLATAVSCVRAGRNVVGVDRDFDVLQRIRDRDLPYDEPDLVGRDLGRLELRGSIEELDWSTFDAWIICVGTNVDGALTPRDLHDAATAVISRAKPEALVAIESTVPPGTCDQLAEIRPDVFVAHCPERGAPGALLEELTTKPRLIGGTTEEATRAALEFYADICNGELVPCSAREAELAKLAENAHRAVNVAFANELAEAARSHGIDPHRLVDLANTHPRVRFLKPGLGVGGDCLPMAVRWFAERNEAGAAAGALRIDASLPAAALAAIQSFAPNSTRVALLGTAYKPDAPYEHDVADDVHSPAHRLFCALQAAGLAVSSWDGLSDSSDAGLDDALDAADVVIFGCSHARFATLDPVKLLRRVAGDLVIDLVGAIDAEKWRAAGWKVAR